MIIVFIRFKVSNNADVDENEPEMIYTALHHAREPGSLTQTIFYLWYFHFISYTPATLSMQMFRQ